MTVTINIKDIFIFLQSPDRVKTVMALHVPALSVLYEKIFLPKERVLREELRHLEPEEYSLDKTFAQINEFSSDSMVPVFQMNVVLHDYTLSITYKGSVQEFARSKISRGDDFEVYRELMSPSYISYNIRHIVFGDSYNEITFSKGIAHLGQINLFLNTSDIDYFSDWSSFMVLPYLSGIKLNGDYEATLRSLIVQHRQIAKPALKKVYKKNLDIVFNGLNLVNFASTDFDRRRVQDQPRFFETCHPTFADVSDFESNLLGVQECDPGDRGLGSELQLQRVGALPRKLLDDDGQLHRNGERSRQDQHPPRRKEAHHQLYH
jgi:hypothetical protein